MRHGYKGAFEIAATVDYMFAFAATADAVKSHHFDLAYAERHHLKAYHAANLLRRQHHAVQAVPIDFQRLFQSGRRLLQVLQCGRLTQKGRQAQVGALGAQRVVARHVKALDQHRARRLLRQ